MISEHRDEQQHRDRIGGDFRRRKMAAGAREDNRRGRAKRRPRRIEIDVRHVRDAADIIKLGELDPGAQNEPGQSHDAKPQSLPAAHRQRPDKPEREVEQEVCDKIAVTRRRRGPAVEQGFHRSGHPGRHPELIGVERAVHNHRDHGGGRQQ